MDQGLRRTAQGSETGRGRHVEKAAMGWAGLGPRAPLRTLVESPASSDWRMMSEAAPRRIDRTPDFIALQSLQSWGAARRRLRAHCSLRLQPHIRCLGPVPLPLPLDPRSHSCSELLLDTRAPLHAN